jgi:hypothetical protein
LDGEHDIAYHFISSRSHKFMDMEVSGYAPRFSIFRSPMTLPHILIA